MKFKFASVLIAGAVLALAGLVGLEVDAQVAAKKAPATPAAPPFAAPPPAAPAAAPPAAPAASPPAAPTTAAVHPGPRYSLDNLVNPFAMDRTEKTDVGYVYWFFDKQFAGNGKTLKLSVVHPHQPRRPHHHHVEDEFWYVLEGKAEFFIDGKTRIVEPRTGMYAPSNVEHGINNAGDTDLQYLVIQQFPDAAASK